MADTTEETLLNTFSEAAGGIMQSVESLTGIARQEPAQAASATKTDGSGSSGGSGAAGEALNIVTTVLESGLGIVPLVAGLIGLFTGGGSDTPAPLVKYAMPSKMAFEGVDTGSGVTAGDYDQNGMPRSYAGGEQDSPGGPAAGASVPAPASSSSSGPQIQVNVQAMDARSFMDHSSEIAQAVRSAMLNLNSLNDVVSDL